MLNTTFLTTTLTTPTWVGVLVTLKPSLKLRNTRSHMRLYRLPARLMGVTPRLSRFRPGSLIGLVLNTLALSKRLALIEFSRALGLFLWKT